MKAPSTLAGSYKLHCSWVITLLSDCEHRKTEVAAILAQSLDPNAHQRGAPAIAPSSELPDKHAAMLQMHATYCDTIMVPMMLQSRTGASVFLSPKGACELRPAGIIVFERKQAKFKYSWRGTKIGVAQILASKSMQNSFRRVSNIEAVQVNSHQLSQACKTGNFLQW